MPSPAKRRRIASPMSLVPTEQVTTAGEDREDDP